MNKIILKSSDHEHFEVEQSVAMQSQTIAHMIDGDCVINGVPLTNVSAKILSKVIMYCRKHAEAEASKIANAADSSKITEEANASIDIELKKWDADFADIDQSTLFELIMAANYLNIPSLLDLTCQTVADMIKGKTPDQIRSIFNIKKDLTPEEEDEILRENQWDFE